MLTIALIHRALLPLVCPLCGAVLRAAAWLCGMGSVHVHFLSCWLSTHQGCSISTEFWALKRLAGPVRRWLLQSDGKVSPLTCSWGKTRHTTNQSNPLFCKRKRVIAFKSFTYIVSPLSTLTTSNCNRKRNLAFSGLCWPEVSSVNFQENYNYFLFWFFSCCFICFKETSQVSNTVFLWRLW